MILTSFIHLNIISHLSPLSSMIFNLILRTTARSETKFVLVSVFIWLYTWNKYLQIFARSHAPYAAHFIRYIIYVWLRRTWTCNSLAFAKRVPYYTISQYKPSLFIKPEATGNGCDDYFWKEPCFCNRSTWKMKRCGWWGWRDSDAHCTNFEFVASCLLGYILISLAHP